ncbi:hypothetical protein IJ596_07295 [bacterium]|nr:hypothetical protein [bacterium]
MITINPVKLTTGQITFGNRNIKNNTNDRAGLMTLDKNSKNQINFEKDLYITRNADAVKTNPLKAFGYSIVKAYNILNTPKKNTELAESNYIHVPYMA